MPSDLTPEPRLTERLAAKLDGWTLAMMYGNRDRDVLWLHNVTDWLPLLLSEPELVAGLPEEVRRDLLRSLIEREVPTMECAFVDAAEVLSFAPDETRLSVLTPRERAVLKLGEAAEAYAKADDEYGSSDGFQDPLIPGSPLHKALQEFDAALAEARALAPEVGNAK